jgi:hypothetical protein
MLESIDQVRNGEYLMCALGPMVTGTDQQGRVVKRFDRSFEGTIVQVVAVSPPMLLLRVFPMPCDDPSHDHSAYERPIRFDYMGWSRPPARYVRKYMEAAKHRKPTRVRGLLMAHPGEVSAKKFNEILDDIYKNGARPDEYHTPADEDGDDDDAQGSPTD